MRVRRNELLSSAPASSDHELRVEIAMTREASLEALHWTPDAASVAAMERFFADRSIVATEHGLVRLGGDYDGGYLAPDDIDDLAACFSPGVADRASFEEDMVARGIPCYLADASVDHAPIDGPLITFDPVFLGGVQRPGWTTLDAWVEEKSPDGDLILQMDIEGWEWSALRSASDTTLERFRIMLIEMHDLHLLATSAGHRAIEETFARLNEHFVLVNVHANNYEYPVRYRGFDLHPVIETAWLRRDRLTATPLRRTASDPRESVNAPGLPDFELDRRWGLRS
ncbi:FkbM family methyltransferase [Janibacter sp. GXQ6167]|uniref:FkbM family methyltransferase n=1 Tax=Janibacter sp. GXQ6167 TaxID=3240791 RepID=UPI00352497F2